MEIIEAVFGLCELADGFSSPKRARETMIGIALAIVIGIVALVVIAVMNR